MPATSGGAASRVASTGSRILECTISEGLDDVTRVRLDGRLDAAGADAIGVKLTAAVVAPGRDAVVDLSGVTFVASLGLRLLISLTRGVTGKGRHLALYGAQPLVQDVLDGAALDQIVPVVPTEAEALATLVD
jgi:anti-sigma B factor antagonist